jgi:hypothetical protein
MKDSDIFSNKSITVRARPGGTASARKEGRRCRIGPGGPDPPAMSDSYNEIRAKNSPNMDQEEIMQKYRFKQYIY